MRRSRPELCGNCPGRFFELGQFDVRDPEGERSPYLVSAGGYKTEASGVPVCIHSDKIGIPPGKYVETAVMIETPAPGAYTELLGWATEAITTSDPTVMEGTLSAIEATVLEYGGDLDDAVALMRQAFHNATYGDEE